MQLRPCDSLFPQNGGGILPEDGRIGNEGIQVNHNSPTPHFFLELRILKGLAAKITELRIPRDLARRRSRIEIDSKGFSGRNFEILMELRILKELREDFRKKQILKKLDRSLGRGEKSARGRCEGSSWPSRTIAILAQPQTHVNANFAVIHMPTGGQKLTIHGVAGISDDGFGHEDVVAGDFGGHFWSERGSAGFQVAEVAIKGREGCARADNAEVDGPATLFAKVILGGIH